MLSSIAKTLRPFVYIAAALAVSAAPISAYGSQPVIPNRIVEPIDNHVRVGLKGYVSPLANAMTDRGPAPASMTLERLHLVLRRSASQETALRQLIVGLNQPATTGARAAGICGFVAVA